MTTLTRIWRRHKYANQVVIVSALTALFTLATDRIGFRSPANLLWMIGLPIVLAVMMNREWDRRAFMAMALVGIAVLVTIVIGVSFISYA